MMPGQMIKPPNALPKRQKVKRIARPIRPGKKSIVAFKRKANPLVSALAGQKPMVMPQGIPSALGMQPQIPLNGGTVS